MASFHFEIKSGRKGVAVEHAAYIARQGWLGRRGDLIFSGHGNLPLWASNDPLRYWAAADRHERANGAAYREMIIALPCELNIDQQWLLVGQLVSELAGDKPFQFAVHASASSLQGETNTHMHLMVSDRMPDGIDRPADRLFSRYNANDPAKGGCRKDSGGRTSMQMRDELIRKRKLVADIMNRHLAIHGHDVRVDHRSLKAQGAQRKPERHLGPARIDHMSPEERAEYVAVRRSIRTDYGDARASL